MLSHDAKLVIDFLEECRSQLVIKDELFTKTEQMYSVLYQLQELLKEDKAKEKLVIQLEDLIISTLNLAKDTYFEYGDNFAQVREKEFISISKEA